MPFLYAVLYVFRWSFLVAGLFNLAVAMYYLVGAQPADVTSALGPVAATSVLISLSFLARVLFDRRAD